MTEEFMLDNVLLDAKAIREERKKKYGDTYKLMDPKALKDFASGKLDRWFVTDNYDDLRDLLVYIEFLIRRKGIVKQK